MFALLRPHGLLKGDWCLQTTVPWPEFDSHRKKLWERITTKKYVHPIFPTSRSKGERYVFTSLGVVEVIQYAKENGLSVIVQFPHPFGLDVAYRSTRRTTLFTEQLLYEFLPLNRNEPFRAWSQLSFAELALVVDQPVELARMNQIRQFADLNETRFAFLHSPHQPEIYGNGLASVHTFGGDTTRRIHNSAAILPRYQSGQTGAAVFLAESLPYERHAVSKHVQTLHLETPQVDILFFLKRSNETIVAESYLRNTEVPEQDLNTPSSTAMYFNYDVEAETWMPLSYAVLREILPQLRAFAENPTSTMIQPCTDFDTPRFRLQRSLSTNIAWGTLRSWGTDALRNAQKEVMANQKRVEVALSAVRADLNKPLPRWVRQRVRPLRLELPELTNAERKTAIKRFVPSGWSFEVLSSPHTELFAKRLGAPPHINTHIRAQRFLLDFELPSTLHPHQSIRLAELAVLFGDRCGSFNEVMPTLPPSISDRRVLSETRQLQNVGDLYWSHIIKQTSYRLSVGVEAYVRDLITDSTIPSEERWSTAGVRRSTSLMLLYIALCHITPFQPTLTPEEEPFRAWFSFLGRNLMEQPSSFTSFPNSIFSGVYRFHVLASDDPLTRFIWMRVLKPRMEITNHSALGNHVLSSFTPPPLIRSKHLHKWMQSVEHNLSSLPPDLAAMDLHAVCSLVWHYRELPVFKTVFQQSTQHFVNVFYPEKSVTLRSSQSREVFITELLFPISTDIPPSIQSLIRGTFSVFGGGLLD